MPINTLTYATQLQALLDSRAVAGLTSGWMDANAGQVKYTGGNKVRMPQMEVTGLKDYDRDTGYPEGSVTVAWADYEMTMDRGTSFQLDAMDVDETNFVATATSVAGQFQKEKVVPEIDAYRYSKLYALLKKAGKNKEYTPEAKTVYDALMDDIAAVRDVVGDEVPLMVSIRQSVLAMLEKHDKFTRTINLADFEAGVIKTKIKQIDNNFLRPVPSSRMKSAYVFADGKTDGQKDGGFKADTDAVDINWIIMPQNAPIAVTKQDKMKIFDPDTYQKADAWYIGYRRYHEVWLPGKRYEKCLANAAAAQPAKEPSAPGGEQG